MRSHWHSALRYLRVPVVGLGFLMCCFTSGAAVYSGLLVWAPAQQAFEHVRQDVVVAQSKIDSFRNRADLADGFGLLEEQTAGMMLRLSTPVDRAQMVLNLSEIAQASGSSIIHGANSFGESRAGLTPVEQELTVEGSYRSVRLFFSALAGIETFTLVRNFEMSADRSGRQLRVKISLFTLSGGPEL